jgi:hypothetical protein
VPQLDYWCALGGSYEEGFDAIYASDDPLDDCDDPRFWFQLDADRNPPSSFPIAGLGVAHGIDPEGNGCDVRISVAELERSITFTERKFKGFSVKTFDSAEQSGLVRAIMQIEPVAPIIDGTDEGKAIKQTRSDSWDAKMLSGEPLITDDQFERLLANYAATAQPVLVVKIFLPHVRWLLCWIYPDDRDLAFAVTKVGNKAPTTGDVRLSNIVRCRLGMLMPERDKYIKLDRPLSHYVLRDVDW